MTLPTGATVLWAGLYWSADTSAGTNGVAATNTTTTGMGTVKFAGPDGAYTTLTAAAGDVLTSSVQPTRYRSFKDVTSLVQTGGSYKVANVQAGTGQDRYAGWSLMVAYRRAADPVRRLSVYDGLGTVDNTHTFSTPITPFHTPASGLVKSRIGMLTFEGDAGYTGETARFNGHDLSDSLNPINNAMNSTIETGGVSFTAKVPDQRNQLNVDLDTFVDDAGLYLSNDQSSATLTFSSTVEYFMPSALFLVSDEGPATNTVLPAISGTATDGQTLTATTGTWTARRRSPTSTSGSAATQRARTAPNRGRDRLQLRAHQRRRQQTLRAVVTATNDAGTAGPATAPRPRSSPRAAREHDAPAITGTATVGRRSPPARHLDRHPAVTYAYQWQRCDAAGANCTDIAGATEPHLHAHRRRRRNVRVTVTAHKRRGTATPQRPPTAGVGTGSREHHGADGQRHHRDGQSLNAATVRGRQHADAYVYQWQRCDTPARTASTSQARRADLRAPAGRRRHECASRSPRATRRYAPGSPSPRPTVVGPLPP